MVTVVTKIDLQTEQHDREKKKGKKRKENRQKSLT